MLRVIVLLKQIISQKIQFFFHQLPSTLRFKISKCRNLFIIPSIIICQLPTPFAAIHPYIITESPPLARSFNFFSMRSDPNKLIFVLSDQVTCLQNFAGLCVSILLSKINSFETVNSDNKTFLTRYSPNIIVFLSQYSFYCLDANGPSRTLFRIINKFQMLLQASLSIS